MPVFVDTNVLVYRRDATEGVKADQATEWVRALWVSKAGRLSLQVLHEYYVTTTRKLDPGLTPAEAREDVRDLMAWDPAVLDLETLEGAWAVEERFGLSFWDSLIVSSAQRARCDLLLTEDMQEGLDLDGMLVVNPFAQDPIEFL